MYLLLSQIPIAIVAKVLSEGLLRRIKKTKFLIKADTTGVSV